MIPPKPSGSSAFITWARWVHDSILAQRPISTPDSLVSQTTRGFSIRSTGVPVGLKKRKIKVCVEVAGEEKEAYMWIYASALTYDSEGYEEPVIEGTPPA